MDRVAERLRSSAGTGEILSIIYLGGSQPGTRRDVVVRGVIGEKLRALCVASGITKTYFVDLVYNVEGVTAPSPAASAQPSAGFVSMVNELAPFLARARFEVRAAPRTIAVHKRFRTGVVQKMPFAVFREYFIAESQVLIWTVANRQGVRSYLRFDDALTAFLVETKLRPAPRTSILGRGWGLLWRLFRPD